MSWSESVDQLVESRMSQRVGPSCRVVPESARWLLSQGKVDKTVTIIRRAARINGKTLAPGVIQEFMVMVMMVVIMMMIDGELGYYCHFYCCHC